MATSKIKKSIWESAEIWEMIEKHRGKDRHQSIAQFIEEAVRHYCCSSDTEDHKEILTRELTNTKTPAPLPIPFRGCGRLFSCRQKESILFFFSKNVRFVLDFSLFFGIM